jgi:hypothetical protein
MSPSATVLETMADRDQLITANDPLLRSLIDSASDEERRAALESIVTAHVLPVIRTIVQRQSYGDRSLRVQDAEDITSTVVLRLVRRLQRISFDEDATIERLADFTATSTYNVIHDFLRRHFPERERLKNRVHYVLAHDDRFRRKSSAAGPVCTLASWPETNEVGQVPVSWRHDDPGAPADAIESLLTAASKPLLISDVLRVLAESWNISESRALPIDEIAASGPSHAAQLEGRQRLEALWRETRALPAPQRAALLLSLRDIDGGSAIALFSLMGVASVNEVADAIELPLQQLASLWPRLPLDDLTIAPILGVTRQQVINLRLAARQRLARRLKKW